MTKINLPNDTLVKDSFKTLPAKEKEEYVSNVLKKILEINPYGITISQIKEATSLTYSTIWHHLEILKCTMQCHKISKGNLDVYYHLGESNHLNDYDKGGTIYTLSTLKNSEGNFVCLHEKRENRLGNYTVLRGIAIPFEIVDDLIKALDKAKKEVKK